jgi:hypothetical protein
MDKMKSDDPAFDGWEFYCQDCKHRLPVDISGKVHKNRQFCPPCFASNNSGKAQGEIPDDWEERCSFRFVFKNFPQFFKRMKKSYIESQGAALEKCTKSLEDTKTVKQGGVGSNKKDKKRRKTVDVDDFSDESEEITSKKNDKKKRKIAERNDSSDDSQQKGSKKKDKKPRKIVVTRDSSDDTYHSVLDERNHSVLDERIEVLAAGREQYLQDIKRTNEKNSPKVSSTVVKKNSPQVSSSVGDISNKQIYFGLVPKPANRMKFDAKVIANQLMKRGYAILKTNAREMTDLIFAMGMVGRFFKDAPPARNLWGSMSYIHVSRMLADLPEECHGVVNNLLSAYSIFLKQVTQGAFGYEPEVDTFLCRHTPAEESSSILHCRSFFQDLPKMLLCLEDFSAPLKIMPYKSFGNGSPLMSKMRSCKDPPVAAGATVPVSPNKGGVQAILRAAGEENQQKEVSTNVEGDQKPAAVNYGDDENIALSDCEEDMDAKKIGERFNFFVNSAVRTEEIEMMDKGDCLLFLGDLPHIVKSQKEKNKHYVYFDTNVVDRKSDDYLNHLHEMEKRTSGDGDSSDFVCFDDSPPTVDINEYCTALEYKNKTRLEALFEDLKASKANDARVKQYGDVFYFQEKQCTTEDETPAVSVGDEHDINIVAQIDFLKAYKMYVGNSGKPTKRLKYKPKF